MKAVFMLHLIYMAFHGSNKILDSAEKMEVTNKINTITLCYGKAAKNTFIECVGETWNSDLLLAMK